MPTLRQATTRDRAFCWTLHVLAMREHVEATWGWDDEDQARRFDTAFDPARISIVECDGQPIGMLVVERDAAVVRLHAIELMPAHQNRGHGTRLLSGIVDGAGDRPVRLQVLKANRALALYRRLGFVVEGDTHTHWRMVRHPRM